MPCHAGRVPVSSRSMSRCSLTASASRSIIASRRSAKSRRVRLRTPRRPGRSPRPRPARPDGSRRSRSAPCHMVPQTDPARQPSRNGSHRRLDSAIPWWISYPGTRWPCQHPLGRPQHLGRVERHRRRQQAEARHRTGRRLHLVVDRRAPASGNRRRSPAPAASGRRSTARRRQVRCRGATPGRRRSTGSRAAPPGPRDRSTVGSVVIVTCTPGSQASASTSVALDSRGNRTTATRSGSLVRATGSSAATARPAGCPPRPARPRPATAARRATGTPVSSVDLVQPRPQQRRRRRGTC